MSQQTKNKSNYHSHTIRKLKHYHCVCWHNKFIVLVFNPHRLILYINANKEESKYDIK